MSPHHFSTGTVSVRHFDGYYWRGEWCDQRTLVTDGFTDFWIHGNTAGANLFIFLHGHFLDIPLGVTDHDSAVAWCERQFARTAVQV